jgi:3-hydroxypropanoate dehydrogenase
MTSPGTVASRPIDDHVLDALFREARSNTEFTDEPVTEDDLRAIYDLARYAPTSVNQQPLRLVAVRSADARARLLPHLTGRNRARTAVAPLTLILAADIDFHEHLPFVFPHAPALRDDLEPRRSDRLVQARFNAALQIGFLVLAVRAAGFAALPMIGFDAGAVDREFFPDGRLQSLLVMNVGKPLPKRYPRLPRLSYQDAVRTV